MNFRISRLTSAPGRLLPALLLACCCALSAACGQKGDLYLPDGEEPVVTQPAGPGALR